MLPMLFIPKVREVDPENVNALLESFRRDEPDVLELVVVPDQGM